MGHALQNIRDVLTTDGILVDLRPVSGRLPLDLVTTDGAVSMGEIDARGMQSDDGAADRAVEAAVGRGWFDPIDAAPCELFVYWGDIDEMSAAMDDSERMTGVDPSLAELKRTHGDRLREDEGARIRCRRTLALATYRAVKTAPAD